MQSGCRENLFLKLFRSFCLPIYRYKVRARTFMQGLHKIQTFGDRPTRKWTVIDIRFLRMLLNSISQQITQI